MARKKKVSFLADRMKTVMVLHPGYDHLQSQYLRGISDYAHEKKTWNLQVNPNTEGLKLRSLERWHGDGVIASLYTKAEILAAQALPQSVVNLSGAIEVPWIPRVMVDQAKMGALAAEHLLSCGLSRFAYFGEKNRWYSELRKRGFLRRLAEAGRSCDGARMLNRFRSPESLVQVDGVSGTMAENIEFSHWTTGRSRFCGHGHHRDMRSLGFARPRGRRRGRHWQRRHHLRFFPGPLKQRGS